MEKKVRVAGGVLTGLGDDIELAISTKIHGTRAMRADLT